MISAGIMVSSSSLSNMVDMGTGTTAGTTVVVGAAIVRTGDDGAASVLCARRSAPPRIAGKWEFPGGKVEAGETDAEAIVRECAEELGVVVEAGSQIGGDQPIDERYCASTSPGCFPASPSPCPWRTTIF